ncbi:MAG: Ig-like domain-containing protein [Treponema sp.]|nr:Ig-like domain-containing protein [Treponema sp.]
MKLKIFTLFLLSIIYFDNCDLLRFSRFEVISWTPGEGCFNDPDNITVSLNFSNDPDRSSVERNFSLMGDGNKVRGNFIWSGNRMTFSPLVHLESNIDYEINLSPNASDKNGLSMDEAFTGNFTTRSANSRPVLLLYYPSMYEKVSDSKSEIRLEFSKPVTLKTLYENVSFSPSMSGLWHLENDNRLAVFIPAEPWIQNNRYEMHVSSLLTDNNGMDTGKDFISIFTAGTDAELPYLLAARRIGKSGEIFQLTPDIGYSGAAKSPFENTGWEKDDRLSLVFSKPADSSLIKNYINVDDGPNLVVETPPGFFSEIIFRFDGVPVYESRFTLRVKPGIKDSSGNESKNEYIFRVFADGKYSKPPVLEGIRIPMAPNNAHDPELKFFGIESNYDFIPIQNKNYPSGESIKTWIELYFSAAQDALIDTFSVMELFRVETSNNVINFYPRYVKSDNFSFECPQAGFENYQRIEITGNLVNSVFSGIINFQIASGLKDSLGNRSDKLQRISLIK